MAITPRTILSQPINLLLFALSILVLGGLLGVLAGANDADRSPCTRYMPPDDNEGDLDVGVGETSDGEPDDSMAAGTEFDRLDYTCRLEDPAPSWSEGQWLRHLGCMEARGEHAEVLVDETTAAIDEVGLTPELAVIKADFLKEVATADEHIDFLDAAVSELGVADGELVHRLARALTWRGEAADIERIRHLQLLSRMLMPDSCEVLQTDMWVRFALADQVAEGPSPAAWQGVRQAIDTYLAQGCHMQHEERDVLSELVGVGVVAEATNGHTGQSTLLRKVGESDQVRDVHLFCSEAVPAGVGLRSACEKRVSDELFLAR